MCSEGSMGRVSIHALEAAADTVKSLGGGSSGLAVVEHGAESRVAKLCIP